MMHCRFEILVPQNCQHNMICLYLYVVPVLFYSESEDLNRHEDPQQTHKHKHKHTCSLPVNNKKAPPLLSPHSHVWTLLHLPKHYGISRSWLWLSQIGGFSRQWVQSATPRGAWLCFLSFSLSLCLSLSISSSFHFWSPNRSCSCWKNSFGCWVHL